MAKSKKPKRTTMRAQIAKISARLDQLIEKINKYPHPSIICAALDAEIQGRQDSDAARDAILARVNHKIDRLSFEFRAMRSLTNRPRK